VKVLIDVIIMAIVGGAIGWFTNFLAIKLLFRPFVPWTVPSTSMKVQGLIPVRRKEIATAIGKAVNEQLLSMHDILNKILGNEQRSEIALVIRRKIVKQIKDKIPSIVPSGLTKPLLAYISQVIDREAGFLLEHVIGHTIENSVQKLNISTMIEEKLNSLDMIEVEALIMPLVGRELRHIEVLGGVLGFIIGLVQGILIRMM